jgi:hypothetical protein
LEITLLGLKGARPGLLNPPRTFFSVMEFWKAA